MKKIGLLTCFLDNYGALLQALSLQHSIEKMGYSCDIIAYIGPYGYRRENFRSMLKPVLHSRARDFINVFSKEKRYNTYKSHLAFYRFRKKYLKFKPKNLFTRVKYYYSINDFEGIANEYDAFVCGSDQIWNPKFYGRNNPVYFLRFAGEKRRIAYAPSIGLSEMPHNYLEEFISYISSFNSLSVREQKGADIIEKTCHRSAKVVLDPTLLVGGDYWMTLLKPKYALPYQNYIFAYIFSNTESCSNYLRQLQKSTRLPIVYIINSNLSYDNMCAYYKSYASPIDFLQLIKNAKFIVTDSFHGTAFSLLFNKDFYVFKRERKDEKIDMYSRIESILSIAGTEDRAVSLTEPFVEKSHIDYTQVNKRLQAVREDSLEYLRTALSGESD